MPVRASFNTLACVYTHPRCRRPPGDPGGAAQSARRDHQLLLVFTTLPPAVDGSEDSLPAVAGNGLASCRRLEEFFVLVTLPAFGSEDSVSAVVATANVPSLSPSRIVTTTTTTTSSMAKEMARSGVARTVQVSAFAAVTGGGTSAVTSLCAPAFGTLVRCVASCSWLFNHTLVAKHCRFQPATACNVTNEWQNLDDEYMELASSSAEPTSKRRKLSTIERTTSPGSQEYSSKRRE